MNRKRFFFRFLLLDFFYIFHKPDSWNSSSIHLSLKTERIHISRFLFDIFLCVLLSYTVDSFSIFWALSNKQIPWTKSTFHECISITMYNKHRSYIDISSSWYSSSNSMMFFFKFWKFSPVLPSNTLNIVVDKRFFCWFFFKTPFSNISIDIVQATSSFNLKSYISKHDREKNWSDITIRLHSIDALQISNQIDFSQKPITKMISIEKLTAKRVYYVTLPFFFGLLYVRE